MLAAAGGTQSASEGEAWELARAQMKGAVGSEPGTDRKLVDADYVHPSLPKQ